MAVPLDNTSVYCCLSIVTALLTNNYSFSGNFFS
jgi:hypothetical protein